MQPNPKTRTFAQDVAFLERHVPQVVILRADASQIAVVPHWQNRIVTAAISEHQPGFGWINYEHIESGLIAPHINVFGGADRFWIGPEGGQFSIFFKQGDPFDLEHWQTPHPIDTDPYPILNQSPTSITCEKEATFINFSGTTFQTRITRTINILTKQESCRYLNLAPLDGVNVVGYESNNALTNIGNQPWTEDGGLLSIWILGMLKHSPSTTVVAPFLPGSETERGPIVNDAYFGKVPADRLKIAGNVIFFKADGNYRSKIGLSQQRAREVIGSYDAGDQVLTIVKFTKPTGNSKYVNSMWEHQANPYEGDVSNSYNDGPPMPGVKPLGPFYEIESSSPAAILEPNQSITHLHQTFHFTGNPDGLNSIALQILGVSLEDIASALP